MTAAPNGTAGFRTFKEPLHLVADLRQILRILRCGELALVLRVTRVGSDVKELRRRYPRQKAVLVDLHASKDVALGRVEMDGRADVHAPTRTVYPHAFTEVRQQSGRDVGQNVGQNFRPPQKRQSNPN
ncbi:hypothetical protein [Acuticoccus sediminis]|uniref:hypothetical protein n=1 Tax=Acuticoccus sediminis TaxID=2184697 RepID=UPI0011B93584|nr:hypothetical protein [Acuticoccus sediminis]